MSKLFVKPAWLAGVALLVAMGVAIKIALALTSFAPADQPIGYVAQDEMTSFNLKSGNETLFRGQYEREFWSGTLIAYPIDENGNVGTGAVWWDAAEEVGCC